MTGVVAAPALMGAPVISIERLPSGKEAIYALKAASAALLNANALKERDAGDGIKEVQNAQDLMSVNNEVGELHYRIQINCTNLKATQFFLFVMW